MSTVSTLVSKATADNRDQAPGFVLQELATKTQSIEDCRAVENLLLKRLEKNKPYIKYKALKAIKYLCDHGAPRWKQSWQSHTDKIRACAQFRGPPDAVYGDSPYENVRKAAKETMDAVFSSTQANNSKLVDRIVGREGPKPTGSSNGSQGMINITAPTTRAPAVSTLQANPKAYNPSYSAGFGNTDYKPKPTGPIRPQKQSDTYVNPNTFTTEYPHSHGKLDNQVSRTSGKRKRKEPGGNWQNDSNTTQKEYEHKDDENSDEELDHNDKGSKGGIGNLTGSMRSTNHSTDGSFEQQWVNSITTAGGIGDKIPDLKQKLQQFQNLSQSHVLEFLDEKLADNSSWQSQAKALTLIEALLNDTASHVVAEYFLASPENLLALAQSKKVSLKKKGTAIARRIGLNIDTNEKEIIHSNSEVFDGEKREENFVLDSWMFDGQNQNQNQNQKQDEDYTNNKEDDGMFDGLDIANQNNTIANEDDGILSLGIDPNASTNATNTSTGFSFLNSTSVPTSTFTSTSTSTFPSDVNPLFTSNINSTFTSNVNPTFTSNVNPTFTSNFNSNPSSMFTSPYNTTANVNPNANNRLFGVGLNLDNTMNLNNTMNVNNQPNATSFDTLFPQTQSNIVNPSLNIPSNPNRLYLSDPFDNFSTQPVQSQQGSKNKKTDKDLFADLALGALQI